MPFTPTETPLMAPGTRQSRYMAPYYGRSYEGPHGIDNHVRTRPPADMRPTGHAVGTPMQPPLAGGVTDSTLNHTLSVLQTKLHIDATQPTAVTKPHRENRIPALLGHRAHPPIQTSRPDAKNTAGSKLWVTGHDIHPGECSRGATRRLRAQWMARLRSSRVRALQTDCWCSGHASWAAAATRRAHFSSWHSPLRRRGAHERRRPSTCRHEHNGRDGRSPACQSGLWVRTAGLPSGNLSP